MRRPPLPAYILTIAALVLVGLMTLEGLHGRVYGSYPIAKGWYWGGSTHLSDWMANNLGCTACLSADTLSWPILMLGLSWLGALVAFWGRLCWAVRSILILGAFSLAFWIPGALMTVIIFVSLWLKSTRMWFYEVHG